MAPKLQPVRGTHDALPDSSALRRHIVETGQRIFSRYNYGEIATPIFEFTDVFARTLGDTSDIVTKEMYSFEDRGGESLTLRPELTAGIARAFISNGLTQTLPCRFWTMGPCFRYERPQKGRMRQFHQIDAECIGVADPRVDVEMIAMAWQFLDALGLQDDVVLELNSLGDAASRTAYREALIAYFSSHREALSEESRQRLERNPLRILDSKAPEDKALVADAPDMHAHFTDEAAAFFDAVKAGLTRLGIPFTLNSTLVRGLDYYCHTVFEFTTDRLGAQNAVLSGGRYDGLVSMMGGPETPAIGWASGMERLEAMLEGQAAEPVRPVAVIPVNDEVSDAAFDLAMQLRHNGLVVLYDYTGNMKKRLQKAGKAGATAAVILGPDELAAGQVILRDMESSEQHSIARDQLVAHLTK